MKIEIWSDFACPFCYIGKKRFENALKKFPHASDVEVSYKAYQLNANAPKVMKGTAYESFADSHHMPVDQVKARFNQVTENAKTVGLNYRYDLVQMTNTFDAHRLGQWAATLGQGTAVLERFMKAYFTEGKNLADHKTLLSLVKELGLDGTKAQAILNSNEFEDVVRQQMAEARQIGVTGVPFFVVDQQYGLSGAQPEEYFLNALNQIWSEQHAPKVNVFEGSADADGQACSDEGCGCNGDDCGC